MPLPRQRRKRQVKRKRDWRRIAFYVLSAAVVISMVLGTVLANLLVR
jgi:hypothetical protein